MIGVMAAFLNLKQNYTDTLAWLIFSHSSLCLTYYTSTVVYILTISEWNDVSLKTYGMCSSKHGCPAVFCLASVIVCTRFSHNSEHTESMLI